MKKNKNIFMASVLLLSLGLASCTDSFLDVTSKTESSTGTFYKTEKDAYRALIGCYDGWRQTSSAMMVGFYMASEVMSAECFGATGNADGRGYQAIDRFDISQSPADLNLYEGGRMSYVACIALSGYGSFMGEYPTLSGTGKRKSRSFTCQRGVQCHIY